MVWRLTKAAVDRWAERLLHVHDTPERTARAFAIGVLVGFSPLLGFHNVLGLAIAFLFNLNRVAVVVGMWVNLPWVSPPFYTGATAFGTWMLGSRMPGDFLPRLEQVWQVPGWLDRLRALGELLKPLLPAYLIGSTVLAVGLAIAGYFVCLGFLRAQRALRHPRPEVR
jgi:uncharacterized protein (DUF2062 family)